MTAVIQSYEGGVPAVRVPLKEFFVLHSGYEISAGGSELAPCSLGNAGRTMMIRGITAVLYDMAQGHYRRAFFLSESLHWETGKHPSE